MHPVLHIEEILDTIFSDPVLYCQTNETIPPEHLLPAEWTYKRHPLLALALTCKTLHEPATRALWKQIDGIDRLVRTMTRDVIKIIVPRNYGRRVKGRISKSVAGTETPEGDLDELEEYLEQIGGRRPTGLYIAFKREPTELDWKIFNRYAAYVQEFGSVEASSDRFQLEGNVYQALRSRFSRPNNSLLPKLRRLSCSGCMQLFYANLLLSPRLHTLQISQPPHKGCFSCVTTFIADVGNSPTVALGSLDLSTHIPQDHQSSFSEMLAKCGRKGTGLKRLRASGFSVTPDLIRLALQGEQLEELTARVTAFGFGEVFDGNEEIHRGSMKKLHIESERIAVGVEAGGILEDRFYSELITRLKAPGLVDFRFQGGPQHPFAQDIRAFLEIISRSGAFSDDEGWRTPRISFTPIKYRIYIPPPTPLPEAYICTFANALHVLCQPTNFSCDRPRFSQLCKLDLHDTFVDLTDEEVGMLAKSMPHCRD